MSCILLMQVLRCAYPQAPPSAREPGNKLLGAIIIPIVNPSCVPHSLANPKDIPAAGILQVCVCELKVNITLLAACQLSVLCAFALSLLACTSASNVVHCNPTPICTYTRALEPHTLTEVGACVHCGSSGSNIPYPLPSLLPSPPSPQFQKLCLLILLLVKDADHLVITGSPLHFVMPRRSTPLLTRYETFISTCFSLPAHLLLPRCLPSSCTG